jgi:hypothetical protein
MRASARRGRRVAVLVAFLGIGLSFATSTSAARPVRPVRLPIHVGVATSNGDPVAPRAFLDAIIARANRVFAPAGLSFELEDIRRIEGKYTHLRTRRDRHALTAELRPEVINVFVVESLVDVDDRTRMRHGVHWRPDGTRSPVHYVIVRAGAVPEVLAHELGHYFGNHRHSEVPGNIMSYVHGSEPFFDERQVGIIHRHVARFLRSGELVPR